MKFLHGGRFGFLSMDHVGEREIINEAIRGLLKARSLEELPGHEIELELVFRFLPQRGNPANQRKAQYVLLNDLNPRSICFRVQPGGSATARVAEVAFPIGAGMALGLGASSAGNADMAAIKERLGTPEPFEYSETDKIYLDATEIAGDYKLSVPSRFFLLCLIALLNRYIFWLRDREHESLGEFASRVEYATCLMENIRDDIKNLAE